MHGTLILAILTVRSSYAAETERPVSAGEVPDTVQWWLGDQAWRIKTFAIDHDIHTYAVGPNESGLVELAKQNNLKHYGDVLAEQHELRFADCNDAAEVAAVLAGARLAGSLEVASPEFVFWNPDDARYHSQTTPK